MTKIMLLCPNPNDGTAFYRAVGPLSAMEDVQVALNPPVEFHTLLNCDLVLFQRPCHPNHRAICENVKASGKPLWVDYDDLLTEVPPENPCYWEMREAAPEIRNILRMADIVTVSTEYLADKLSDLAARIVLIKNRWNPSVMKLSTLPRKKTVFWRGTPTHMADVYRYADDIAALAHSHPDWEWVFMGMYPWFLKDKMPPEKMRILRPCGIGEYFQVLSRMDASIMVVPLVDNPFNRAKSNIAQIEAAVAGAVAIVPDWYEWKHNGSMNYDAFNFRAILKAVMLPSVLNLSEYVQESRNHFSDEWVRSLTDRESVIHELVG